MKKKIILHIGTNKTGTSTIQKYLGLNKEKLLSQKVLYPSSGQLHFAHYKFSAIFNLNTLPEPIDSSILKEELEKEIKETGCNTIIISSEYFILAKDIDAIKEYFIDYEVFVLVYLRRHDEWYESLYNQSIKILHPPKWEKGILKYVEWIEYTEKQATRYKELLDKWANVFGLNFMLVRPFEKEQFVNNDLIYDFLYTIGGNKFITDVGKYESVNESINNTIIPIAEGLNRLDILIEKKHKAFEILKQIKLENKIKYNLTQEIRQSIINSKIEEYNSISEKYFNNQPLFKDLTAKPDEENNFQDIYSKIISDLVINYLNSTDDQETSILREASAQIFWSTDDFVFIEKKSISQHIKLKDVPTTISFIIPEQKEKIEQIRLDLGNQPGFLIINDIKIKNKNEKIIWDWRQQEIVYKNEILFIKHPDFINEIIQLSLSNDPFFVIASDLFEFGEIKLELVISSVVDTQLKALIAKNNALSFSSRKEYYTFRNEIDKYKSIQDQLVKELVSTQARIGNYKNKNSLLEQINFELINQNNELLKQKNSMISKQTDQQINIKNLNEERIKSNLIKNNLSEEIAIQGTELMTLTNKLIDKNIEIKRLHKYIADLKDQLKSFN